MVGLSDTLYQSLATQSLKLPEGTILPHSGLDWAGTGLGQVVDACECGDEPSGSIKCGEFLD